MGHVKHMGITEMHTEFWWGNLEEKKHLEDLIVNGNIILKCIVQKYNGKF
jgi:hypothetical protein